MGCDGYGWWGYCGSRHVDYVMIGKVFLLFYSCFCDVREWLE